MKPLLIPNNLDSDQATSLVIDTSNNLPETTFSEDVDDLIPKRKVITLDDGVVSSLIVVAKVRIVRLNFPNMLGRVLRAAEVNVFEVNNLSALINVEMCHLHSLLRGYPLLWRSTFSEGVEYFRSLLRLFPS